MDWLNTLEDVYNVQGINSSGQMTGGPAWRADPASGDATPVISLVSVGSTQAVFSVVDPIAGIFLIDTFQTGCLSSVDTYSQGQKTPVSVTFTKTDSGTCSLDIDAVNILGLFTRFDPVLMSIDGTSSLQPESLTGVPSEEHILKISNGNPGLNSIALSVDGHPLELTLSAGESRTLNLARWMRLSDNTVEISASGPRVLMPQFFSQTVPGRFPRTTVPHCSLARTRQCRRTWAMRMPEKVSAEPALVPVVSPKISASN